MLARLCRAGHKGLPRTSPLLQPVAAGERPALGPKPRHGCVRPALGTAGSPGDVTPTEILALEKTLQPRMHRKKSREKAGAAQQKGSCGSSLPDKVVGTLCTMSFLSHFVWFQEDHTDVAVLMLSGTFSLISHCQFLNKCPCVLPAKINFFL